MATPDEVEMTIRTLAQRLAETDPEVRRRYTADRTISCRVFDLDVVWHGRIGDDGLQDVSSGDGERAQVRLSVSSDDLLALAEGRLPVGQAFATGRLRVQASPLDLLKLRALL